MLARRTCASVRGLLHVQPASIVRQQRFGVSAALEGQNSIRAPSLADIPPNGAASFNEKSKKFRESLAAAQKQKEQEESMLHTHAHPKIDLNVNWSEMRSLLRKTSPY